MKKFLIIFGYFLVFLISAGTMFKLMHWPGAGALLVIGINLLCVIFLPVFFLQRILEKKTALNVMVNILGFFTTSMLFMGVMFKIMHWPGAGPMIVVGTSVFIFPTMLLYVIQQFKENGRKFSEFWRTVVVSLIVCVFFCVFGLSYTRNILYTYLKVEDGTLKTNEHLKDYNNFMLEEIKGNSANKEQYYSFASKLVNSSEELNNYIEALKEEVISIVEFRQMGEQPTNHWEIGSLDNYDMATHLLGMEYSEKGIALHQKLVEFKQMIAQEMEKLPLENKSYLIEDFLNNGIQTELNPNLSDGGSRTWNQSMFYDVPMAGTLSLLTGIQNELLNAEFKALSTINKE